uniref:Uncharacterized protein n=1 Tax=Musa acuminata subsp. malaccensis TaxID=214687 RepID=A0A804HZU1_MUSAM
MRFQVSDSLFCLIPADLCDRVF